MFFVRADGNAKIGAGHLMRCLTVADEMPNKGEVCFLCGERESAALAESRGYMAKILCSAAFSSEEAAEVNGLTETMTSGSGGNNCILVDSYLASDLYLEKLSANSRVAYMDDMMDKPYPHADMLVNYNAFADREKYQKIYRDFEKQPELLLGASYIPVRKQFRNVKYEVNSAVSNILITTGGGDVNNIAGSIVRRLEQDKTMANVTYHVVSGAFNPHAEELQAMAEREQNIVIHKNVEDMAGLMASCDIAVTAGGTTVYELCSIGVPLICFAYAENQKQLERYMHHRVSCMGAGYYSEHQKVTLNRIADAVQKMIQMQEMRMQISETEKKLIDGYGAGRLAEKLCVE